MVLGIIFGAMAFVAYLIFAIERRIVSYGFQYCSMVDDLRQIVEDAKEADKRDDAINKQFYLKTDNISIPEYKPSDKKSYYIALEIAIDSIERLYNEHIEKFSFAYRYDDWDDIQSQKNQFLEIAHAVRINEWKDGCIINWSIL